MVCTSNLKRTKANIKRLVNEGKVFPRVIASSHCNTFLLPVHNSYIHKWTNMSKSNPNLIIVSSAFLPSQHWWPDLYSMIIASVLNKNICVYPPTWMRLREEPQQGALGLAQELGVDGCIAVVFSSHRGSPIACSGILHLFRGKNWIYETSEEKSNAEVTLSTADGSTSDSDGKEVAADWRICCFCVHPLHRGRGLSYLLLDSLITFLKAKGAKRLLSTYSARETGEFWRKLGFEVIPGVGRMLPKGYKADPEKEGLKESIIFKIGVKVL